MHIITLVTPPQADGVLWVLDKSSQKAGLEEVMISTHCNQISTNEIWKGYVFFHPDGLENHKIIFEIDKKFANKGSFLVMQHEKQHFENPAHEAAVKPIKYTEEETIEEKNELNSKKFIEVESQVNLQTANNKFTAISEKKREEDEIINEVITNIATENVYADFIYKGIDILKQESVEDRYLKVYKFLKESTIKEIIKEENRIKKELLEKYNKIQASINE